MANEPGKPFGLCGFHVRAATAFLGLMLCAAVAGDDAPAPSEVPRHPLETRALVEPDAVLAEIPAAIERASATGAHREVALLLLARANACRVIADWSCQRSAAIESRQAASRAGDAILGIRALIAESRARIALQDYTRGEALLGQAELQLQQTPSPELSADVFLAYSSLSQYLERYAPAAEYADRGLRAMQGVDDPLIKARLLRNRARALAQLGDMAAARTALDEALQLLAVVNDPKLAADLHLEAARVAHLAGDVAAQRFNGERIIELSRAFENSQLAGFGHEVLGLADQQSGDLESAQRRLEAAYASFRDLGQSRDELRAARELLEVKLGMGERAQGLAPLIQRFLDVESTVVRSDRAQASDDFDARLKYARQEADVARLETEALLARERERALADTNRLTRWLSVLAFALLIVMAVFFALQRRSNVRLRKALTALRESELRASELLRSSKGFVFLHDVAGVLLMANPATAEALGLTGEALVGRRLAEFVPEAAQPALSAYLERVVADGQHDGVLVIRQRDDSERHWRYSSRLSRPADVRPYVIGQAVDVTEQVRQTETLRAQSEQDSLTGAWNRRYIEGFELRQVAGSPWGAIVVDLDHFKQINDTQGHERGDQVLVGFAKFLTGKIRETDAVVRSGGDEFLILLADTDAETVTAMAQRIVADAASAPCAFSIGQAVRVADEAIAATIARADAAMYGARNLARAGGGRGAAGT